MPRHFRRIALAAALAGTGSAHALTTGDLAFTSFNADEDGWSMVTFVDIAANTTLWFTDNEAVSSSAFNTGESAHVWNSGAGVIAAGTVIRFSAIDTVPAASFGTLSFASSDNLGLSATNETIYAYLGTAWDAPTTFIAAVSSEGSANISAAGLTAGVNAVVVTNSTDYAAYSGPRSGEMAMADYRALVNDNANWTIAVGGDQSAMVPDTTAFTTAVPEADRTLMMLAGLGLLGFIARRRVG